MIKICLVFLESEPDYDYKVMLMHKKHVSHACTDIHSNLLIYMPIELATYKEIVLESYYYYATYLPYSTEMETICVNAYPQWIGLFGAHMYPQIFETPVKSQVFVQIK